MAAFRAGLGSRGALSPPTLLRWPCCWLCFGGCLPPQLSLSILKHQQQQQKYKPFIKCLSPQESRSFPGLKLENSVSLSQWNPCCDFRRQTLPLKALPPTRLCCHCYTFETVTFSPVPGGFQVTQLGFPHSDLAAQYLAPSRKGGVNSPGC